MSYVVRLTPQIGCEAERSDPISRQIRRSRGSLGILIGSRDRRNLRNLHMPGSRRTAS